MDKKTIENLSTPELVKKWKKWLDVKAFGATLEKEIKLRYEEKPIKGVLKYKIRETKRWIQTKGLPKKFLTEPPSVSKAIELFGEDVVNKHITKQEVYSYKPEN